MSPKKACLLTLFAAFSMTMVSCTPTIVGTDAGVWSAGTLHAVSSRDLASVYDAALKAVEQLELKVTYKAKDVFSARIIAQAADGKKITIRMKPAGQNRTTLRINVALLGNETRSRAIYQKIQQNLGIKK